MVLVLGATRPTAHRKVLNSPNSSRARMAKKRKKDKEQKEEYEFTPPDFDEREFLLKELRDTKTVLVTVGYGALLGIVIGLLSNFNESLAPVGLGMALAGILSLKYFYPLIKIDTSSFQKKNWVGSGAWFFFTFLAVWVLTLNFPFSDHADPTIDGVTVWVDNGTNITAIDYKYVDSLGRYTWVPRWGEDVNTLVYASSSYTVNITAKVADNGQLSTVRLSVNGGDLVMMNDEGEHRFGYEITGDQLTSGSLSFSITAWDDSDHEAVFTPAVPIPVN